jgi:photosystem II stability/assembly factor-like uncharacterized protein
MKLLLRIIFPALFLLAPGISYAQPLTWQQTNGPEGGRITDVLVHSTGIYIATRGNGTYRSTDNCSTWQQLSENRWARSIDIAPNGTLFESGWGLKRSLDSGQTWTYCYPNKDIADVDFNASGEIFAASDSGVYKSSDNGNTWAQVLVAGYTLRIKVDAAGTILAANNWGLYRSADNGATWTSHIGNTISSIAQNPVNNDLYATAINTGSGIYRSTDGGLTWSLLLTALGVNDISVNSSGEIFYGTSGVFRSTDNGASFQLLSPASSGWYAGTVSRIGFAQNGNILAGTIGSGIYGSTDNGSTWITFNNGLLNAKINYLMADPSGNIYACSHYDNGVYKSADEGQTWNLFFTTSYEPRAVIMDPGGNFYVGTYTGGVFRSADNGNTWTQANNGLTFSNHGLWVISMTAHPNGSIFAGCGGGGGIFRSTDGGNSWTQVLPGSDVPAIAVSPSGDIYACYNSRKIYRSSDGGTTWTLLTTLNTFLSQDILDFKFNQSGHIFAATFGKGVYRSVDNGATWFQLSMGISYDQYTTGLAIDNSGIIYASHAGQAMFGTHGIYASSDNGNTWVLADSGLTVYNVNKLLCLPNDHLFAATDEASVWRSNGGSVPVGAQELPEYGSLNAYPNPFETFTNIGFSADAEGEAKVMVYSATGQLVDVICLGHLDKGDHMVRWQAENIPPGIYFCRIETAERRMISKLVKY